MRGLGKKWTRRHKQTNRQTDGRTWRPLDQRGPVGPSWWKQIPLPPILSVLLYASVERFSVSRMQDFLKLTLTPCLCTCAYTNLCNTIGYRELDLLWKFTFQGKLRPNLKAQGTSQTQLALSQCTLPILGNNYKLYCQKLNFGDPQDKN